MSCRRVLVGISLTHHDKWLFTRCVSQFYGFFIQSTMMNFSTGHPLFNKLLYLADILIFCLFIELCYIIYLSLKIFDCFFKYSTTQRQRNNGLVFCQLVNRSVESFMRNSLFENFVFQISDNSNQIILIYVLFVCFEPHP